MQYERPCTLDRRCKLDGPLERSSLAAPSECMFYTLALPGAGVTEDLKEDARKKRIPLAPQGWRYRRISWATIFFEPAWPALRLVLESINHEKMPRKQHLACIPACSWAVDGSWTVTHGSRPAAASHAMTEHLRRAATPLLRHMQ